MNSKTVKVASLVHTELVQVKNSKMISKYFLTKIYIFVFLLLLCGGSNCPEFEPEDYKNGQRSPKIVITTVPENIKYFDGNYSVVIDGIGIDVRFDCWAPYPIDVKFKGHLTNRGATVGLIERKVKDPNDLSTYCFSINVTLVAYEEITGEYTCFSVTNQTLMSSHYIYHAAHPPETLLNRNMVLRLVLDDEEAYTTFPCPSSNPAVPVYLYKNTLAFSFQNMVEDGTQIRYNPQVGFIVNTSLIDINQATLYRCATVSNGRDVVDIIVTRPTLKVIGNPSFKIITVNEGEEVRVECQAVDDIFFENSNPEVKGYIDFSGQVQRKMGYAHVRSYKTEKLKATEGGGVISCISTKTNETLFEWSYRVLVKKENKTGKKEKRDGMTQQPILNSPECKLATGSMRIALYDCANWVECNLRKCNYLDRNCESIKCDDAKTSNCVKNGIIQCFNPNNKSVQTEIYFSGIQNRKIYSNWNSIPLQSILKISTNGNYSKQNFSFSKIIEMEFICEGTAFVFAVGFKWYLVNSNIEDNKEIQVADENVQHRWKNLASKNIIRSIAKINVSEETSQIICKAPVWNTTEWKEDTLNFTLLLLGNLTSTSYTTSLNSTSLLLKIITFVLMSLTSLVHLHV